jgi:hypothetical protein
MELKLNKGIDTTNGRTRYFISYGVNCLEICDEETEAVTKFDEWEKKLMLTPFRETIKSVTIPDKR